MIGASLLKIPMNRPTQVLILILCSTRLLASDDADVSYVADELGDRKPLQTMVPVYPELARRERVEGEVQVCFNVDRDGKTRRVRVRKSTNRIFEKPSVQAVRVSTYVPLPEGEEPSGIKTCRTFRFHLSPVAIEKPE